MTTVRQQLEEIVRTGGFSAWVGCDECSGSGAIHSATGVGVPCPICNASGVSLRKLLESLELVAKAIVVPGAHTASEPQAPTVIPDLESDIPQRASRPKFNSDQSSVTFELDEPGAL